MSKSAAEIVKLARKQDRLTALDFFEQVFTHLATILSAYEV